MCPHIDCPATNILLAAQAQGHQGTPEVPWVHVPVGAPTQQVMCPPFHVTMGAPELSRSHIGLWCFLQNGRSHIGFGAQFVQSLVFPCAWGRVGMAPPYHPLWLQRMMGVVLCR